MSPYLTEPSDDSHKTYSQELKDAFPHIDEDPTTVSLSVDPFTITTSTGFMPLRDPQIDLPPMFQPLADLVAELPVLKFDGAPGLLATYQLGPIIDAGEALPDLNHEIDNLIAADGEPDLAAVTAVFRDYAFVASAYLLEPCWERQCKGLEGYGLGRHTLPKAIAGPLVNIGKM